MRSSDTRSTANMQTPLASPGLAPASTGRTAEPAWPSTCRGDAPSTCKKMGKLVRPRGRRRRHELDGSNSNSKGTNVPHESKLPSEARGKQAQSAPRLATGSWPSFEAPLAPTTLAALPPTMALALRTSCIERATEVQLRCWP